MRVRTRQPELDGCLGVCLDTCHVSDAGYDIVHEISTACWMRSTVRWGLRVFAPLTSTTTKNPCGAHKDRHEVIGAATLGSADLGGGEEVFARIVSHPRACADCRLFWKRPMSLRVMRMRLRLLRGLRGLVVWAIVFNCG